MERPSSDIPHDRDVDLGIALDGEGRLGRPEAVTAVARAADLLDYGTIWCIGPWAMALAGAVAAVTVRVRIGFEPPTGDPSPLSTAADRLVVAELAPWPPGRIPVQAGAPTPAPVRLDVRASEALDARDDLRSAAGLGVPEVVVRLVGDPEVDEALAAYAVLGELAEASSPGV